MRDARGYRLGAWFFAAWLLAMPTASYAQMGASSPEDMQKLSFGALTARPPRPRPAYVPSSHRYAPHHTPAGHHVMTHHEPARHASRHGGTSRHTVSSHAAPRHASHRR